MYETLSGSEQSITSFHDYQNQIEESLTPSVALFQEQSDSRSIELERNSGIKKRYYTVYKFYFDDSEEDKELYKSSIDDSKSKFNLSLIIIIMYEYIQYIIATIFMRLLHPYEGALFIAISKTFFAQF